MRKGLRSNQGRDVDGLWSDATPHDVKEASKSMWIEVRHHGPTSTCECPLIEGLARLYELGYELKKVR